MEEKIKRKFKSFPVTLSTTESSSVAIRLDDVAGGCVAIGAGSTAVTSLQVWGCGSTSGTFGRLKDSSGVASDITLSQTTSTPSVYSLPDAAYGCGAIKIVGAEGVSVTVMLKS